MSLLAHEIIVVVCCSMSLSLIDLWSTTANANEIEKEGEKEIEKKKEKRCSVVVVHHRRVISSDSRLLSLSCSLVFCFCCSGIGRPPPDCSRPPSLLLFPTITSSNNCS